MGLAAADAPLGRRVEFRLPCRTATAHGALPGDRAREGAKWTGLESNWKRPMGLNLAQFDLITPNNAWKIKTENSAFSLSFGRHRPRPNQVESNRREFNLIQLNSTKFNQIQPKMKKFHPRSIRGQIRFDGNEGDGVSLGCDGLVTGVTAYVTG